MFNAHRILPAALMVTTLMAAPACATPAGYYGSPSVRTADARAYRVGYDDGRSRGESDARHNRRASYDRHKEFRSASDGYRGYGSRNLYRDEYRRGFAAGYDDSYRRYLRSDRRW